MAMGLSEGNDAERNGIAGPPQLSRLATAGGLSPPCGTLAFMLSAASQTSRVTSQSTLVEPPFQQNSSKRRALNKTERPREGE